MEKGATVKLVLDPRSNRVKVRVTYNRQPRLYSTLCNSTITKEEFDNGKLKKTKVILNESESAIIAAQEISNELGSNFSFSKFTKLYKERLYGGKPTLSDKFEYIANRYIANLQTISTKNIYQTAVNWVLRYNQNIRVQDISPNEITSFIKNTHKAETGIEISENSIRIYLRSLRAIYGQAIRDGITKEPNPFAHIKGQPLSSIVREKGALNDVELSEFLNYEPRNQSETFGKDMFTLSLLLCGANLGDILSLKNSNIVGDEIQFVRRKTRKSNLIVSVPLTDAANEILCKYGRIDSNSPDEYILPFLSQSKTDNAIQNKIHDIIKRANKGIRNICENIGIRHITTYNARHTYAVRAQDNNMSSEQIQKFLGHANSRTTQIYLGSITQKVKDKNRNMLESLIPNDNK